MLHSAFQIRRVNEKQYFVKILPKSARFDKKIRPILYKKCVQNNVRRWAVWKMIFCKLKRQPQQSVIIEKLESRMGTYSKEKAIGLSYKSETRRS